MTDEERRNRNPKVETTTMTREDFEKIPELRTADLELHRAYILEGPRVIATFNYMGKELTVNPLTMDAVIAYCFRGPRANLNLALQAGPDGTLMDGAGQKITIRKYDGPDQ